MNYTRSYLKSRINAAIKNKIGMLPSPDDTCNQAIRETFAEIPFVTAKRKVSLSAGLFTDYYSYPCPVDLSGTSITDIAPIDPSNKSTNEIVLNMPEEFWRKRSMSDALRVAVDESDSYKKLLISFPVSDSGLTISTLDSVTSGGGTWSAFSASTSNVVTNSDDYIKGSGSVMFDINAVSGTTAGIENTGLDSFDFSDFMRGQVFTYAYIVDSTNITNYKLRVGSDSSNYYEMTATATNESTPFLNGWNLLRFSVSSATTVGSPDNTAGTYVALYMTKSTSKVSEEGYLFDQLVFKKGPVYTVTYYTQYCWVSTSGVYKLDSTDDSDYLLVSPEEFDIVLTKAIELAAQECAEYGIAESAMKKFNYKKEIYGQSNPNESLNLTSEYYVF